MYRPPPFDEDRDDEIQAILDHNPLATLIGVSEGTICAEHIPMIRAPENQLIGHVALANDFHRIIHDGDSVLSIFQAADAYISPNWYPSKQQHHRHVPTWNYQAVHVRGTITFCRDVKTKRAIVGMLTQHFEGRTNPDRPWKMADAPKDYMDAMLDAIVGFQIAISGLEAKSKLSQNREPMDQSGVKTALAERGDHILLDAMTRTDKTAG